MQQIEHIGIVQHIEGSKAQILIIQQSACSACHAKSACTVMEEEKKIVDVVVTDSSIKEGDQVVIFGRNSMGLQAVLLAFIFPLLLIVLTLIISNYFQQNETISGILALCSIFPYYGILSLFNHKLKRKFEFHVKKESLT